ncbi:MAG: beta-carotene hydroxylase, partial [Halieaceae bacterium]
RVPLGIYTGQFSYYRENRWARAPGNQNLYLCLEVAAGLLPRLALLAGGLWMEALGLFVVSWWLGLMVTLYLFAYLVHRPHDAVGRYVDSSVVLAPGPLGPIVTALWVCQNYHAIHHLFPRVPFYHYPALYQDIGQIMLARGAPVYQLSWQGLTEQGSPTLA